MKLLNSYFYSFVFVFFISFIAVGQNPGLSISGNNQNIPDKDLIFKVNTTTKTGKFRDFEGWDGKLDQVSRPSESKEKLDETSNLQEASTQKYFIVVGSFGSNANAMKYRQSLDKSGYNSHFILYNKEKNIYQVCLAKTQTIQDASDLLSTYTESGRKGWILELN